MKERKNKTGLQLGKTAEAYIFLTPFLLGAAIFLIYPLFMTVKLSFGQLSGGSNFDLNWLEFSQFFKNYSQALFVDTTFVPILLEEIKTMLIRTPLILALSLIIAICLSRKIKFRGFFRLAFFLPFLLGTGNVLKQMLDVGVDSQVLSLESVTVIPPYILSYLGDNVVEMVNLLFNNIVLVLWNSGVQILLFMSGVLSISPSLYESASIDGASEWEKFWKITLPMEQQENGNYNSLWTAKSAATGANVNATGNSCLVSGIFKDGVGEADNAARGAIPIYANGYVKLTVDGQEIVIMAENANPVVYSMQTVMEAMDTNLKTALDAYDGTTELTGDAKKVFDFYGTWQSAMSGWGLPNLAAAYAKKPAA